MIRTVGGVVMVAVLVASPARAAGPETESAPADPAIPDSGSAESFARIPTEAYSRARVADPWFTRGSVTAWGGVSSWSTSMPTPGVSAKVAGNANGGGMSLDLYGRRMGFSLALSGAATQNVGAPVEGVQGSRFTAGEARLAFTGVLWNSEGLFVSAGPGFEMRAAGYGSLEEGDECFTSWQTGVAGADVRARVFVGPHLYFTGSAFAGALPITGTWQTVDAANSSAAMTNGTLSNPLVVAGNLAAAVRPTEWMALEGGIAMRSASWSLSSGSNGREQAVRPYLGFALLY